MTETEIQETIDRLLDGVEEMSPYRLSKIATILIGKKVQGPMIYNYVEKKYIRATTNSLGHLVVSSDDAREWLTKYATKKFVKND